MNWNNIQHLFQIEITKSELELIKNSTKVVVVFNKTGRKGYYTFNNDMIEQYELAGIDFDSMIKHRIIKDFDLEKWISEKIKL